MQVDLKPLLDMGCRRCKKPIDMDAQAVLVQGPPPGRPKQLYFDGDALATLAVYHARCLPPNMHHRLAGSFPARQSPVAPSLSNEHDAAGG